MISALLTDLSVVAGLWLLGYLLTRAILGRVGLVDALCLAFPLGGGVFSWLLFLLSWAGVRLSLASAAGTWLLAVTLAGAGAFRARRSPYGAPALRLPMHWLSWPVWAVILGLVAVAVVLAVGRSYSTWDAMAIYAVKGYGMARGGTIYAAEQWGPHGLTYPLNVPLLITLFCLWGGDGMPGSKLIFPAVYLSVILACYGFWRRQRLREPVPSLGALLVASVPVVFEHATIGYANLFFSFYLVMGVLLAIVAAREKAGRCFALSGLLLGLATWTRPEGLLMVVTVVVALVVGHRLAGRRGIPYGTWLAPAVAVALAWQIFVRPHAAGSQMAEVLASAVNSLRRLQFHPGALYRIVRYAAGLALRPSNWGLAFPLCGLVLVMSIRHLRWKAEPEALSLLLAGVATAAAVVGSYYAASFAGPSLDWWLGTGFERMMMPALLMGIALAFMLAGTKSASVESRP